MKTFRGTLQAILAGVAGKNSSQEIGHKKAPVDRPGLARVGGLFSAQGVVNRSLGGKFSD